MKKRILLAITLIAAITTLVGCGNNENVTEDTTEEVVVEDIDPTEYVTPGDYSAITVELAAQVEVTEEDLDAKIAAALQANTSYELITDRVAEDGDLVEINYIGTADGEEFDSGTIGSDGDDFMLGSGNTIEGFEEAIIGMSIAEEKVAEITFPEDYTEELAGKDAEFDITLVAIKKVVIPEILTEEMITAINPDCTTEEELRAAYKVELETARAETYLQDTENAMFNVVLANSTFVEELPASMITEYETQLVSETEQWAEAYGIDLDTLVTTYYGQTMDEYYADVTAQATTYVKSDLLMQALILKEEIEVTSDEVAEYAEEIYADYGYESAEVFIETIGEPQFVIAISSERMFDILMANTTVEDLVEE